MNRFFCIAPFIASVGAGCSKGDDSAPDAIEAVSETLHFSDSTVELTP